MSGVDELKEITSDLPEVLQKALDNPEELHEALRPFVVEVAGATWIKHPILFAPFHLPILNATVNKQFRQKLQLLSQLEQEEKWFGIIFLIYERPYRLEAFMELEHHFSDDDYWTLLGAIWTDSENIWQNEEDWRTCFTEHRSGRVDHLMEDEEREVYKSLPPVMTVYRGYRRSDRADGLSWSLSEERAKWFATRFPSQEEESPRVTKGQVKREHVLAYFGSRQEDEIVVFPEWVTDREDYEA